MKSEPEAAQERLKRNRKQKKKKKRTVSSIERKWQKRQKEFENKCQMMQVKRID